MNKKEKILLYYPMIHKDKLLYKLNKDTIRIGTDDNDVIEIGDPNHIFYPVLKDMNGENSIEVILRNHSWLSINKLSSILIKLSSSNSISILKKPFSMVTQNNQFKSDLTYYFSEGKNGEEILNTLSHLKIVILGCGGGGSLIALQLANLGVKHLHLVDYDKVEISNLHRQFMFDVNDIGKPKVEVVKKYLKARHTNMNITLSSKKITKVSDVVSEILNSDWVFCCMDEPPYISQRLVNRGCYLKKIPSVYGFSSRDAAKMMIVNPDETACIDCLLTDVDNDSFKETVLGLKNGDFSPVTPIIVPNMMLETSWMCKKWLDTITFQKSKGNKLYRFDYNSFKETTFLSFNRVDKCPTCGTEKNISKLWQIIPIN